MPRTLLPRRHLRGVPVWATCGWGGLLWLRVLAWSPDYMRSAARSWRPRWTQVVNAKL